MAFQSPAPQSSVNPQEIPLQMVGGNRFGRYPKISDEQTWNMIVSDNALVDYAGFENLFANPLVTGSTGRGIYKSHNADLMFTVIGSAFFSINIVDGVADYTFLGTLTTAQGDVFISENNNNEIAITDEKNLYVYNFKIPTTPLLLQSTRDFAVGFTTPGYISFQLGRLIIADLGTSNWYLSGINAATQWSTTFTANVAYIGAIGLKPDTIQAAVPVPGGGNNIALFGNTVMELWQYTGNAIFPYQRQSTFNIDYGALNASSIAALDSYIVWISANEQGGATVMKFNGGGEESISADGIDFKLANLTNPTNCTAFLFRQDGHLIYQFTFPDDNISLIYDFNTKLFFYVSDENQNYHPARNVVFFQNDYYFVSLNDGNVYTFGTQFSSLQYSATNIQMMYRSRICPPIRLPSQRMFIIKSLGFTVENGQSNKKIGTIDRTSTDTIFLTDQSGIFLTDQKGVFLINGTSAQIYPDYINDLYTEAIDLSISRDGADSWGNSVRQQMNPTGNRRSRLIFQRLGQCNDMTAQINFVGYSRFTIIDQGVVEAYT
jgi:hypothetical protein